jgi:hypothetical protein
MKTNILAIIVISVAGLVAAAPVAPAGQFSIHSSYS